MSLTQAEKKLSNQFQDAIGAIVDQYIEDGAKIGLMQDVLRDEAERLPVRAKELGVTADQQGK